MRKNDSDKKAAFELFGKGFSINHVASKIPAISQRTLFRWYDDYVKSGGTDYRKTYYIDAIMAEEKPAIKTVLPTVEAVDDSDDSWLDSATKTVREISTNNARIRKRLEELLFQEIGELDDNEKKSNNINYRAVTCLINSIILVQKQEWVFGSFSYLDINRAAKFVHSLGYKISEMEAVKDE